MLYHDAALWGVVGVCIGFCAACLSGMAKESWTEAAAVCAVTAMYGAAVSLAFSLPFSVRLAGFYVQLVSMTAISGVLVGYWQIMAVLGLVSFGFMVGTLILFVRVSVPVATVLIGGLVILTVWGTPAVSTDTLWKLLLSYAVLVVAAIVLRVVRPPARA